MDIRESGTRSPLCPNTGASVFILLSIQQFLTSHSLFFSVPLLLLPCVLSLPPQIFSILSIADITEKTLQLASVMFGVVFTSLFLWMIHVPQACGNLSRNVWRRKKNPNSVSLTRRLSVCLRVQQELHFDTESHSGRQVCLANRCPHTRAEIVLWFTAGTRRGGFGLSACFYPDDVIVSDWAWRMHICNTEPAFQTVGMKFERCWLLHWQGVLNDQKFSLIFLLHKFNCLHELCITSPCPIHLTHLSPSTVLTV